jgi:hypothetical protein
MFWLQAFGPLRPFGRAAPVEQPLWWLAGSLLVGGSFYWLPRWWYRLRRFERSGRIYEMAGVKALRALVSNGDLVNRIVRRRFPGYRVHAFAARVDRVLVEGQTNERSHLICFAAGVVTAAYAWRIGWIDWAAWLALTNVAANLYPALVQRYTRGRLERITRRPL